MDGFTATLDVSGVLAKIDRLPTVITFLTRRLGQQTAMRIVAEARARVARDTRLTQNGVHYEMTRDGTGFIVLAYQAGAQAPVHDFLEYGTVYMHAQPFFFEAAAIENASYHDRLADAIESAITDLGLR